MSDVKFPNVYVPLVGEDGNAFSILGRVGKALRKGGATREQIDEFTTEATSGDYNHLLATCCNWVNEGSPDEDYDEDVADDDYEDDED